MARGAPLSIHDIAHIRGYFNRYYQTDLDPDDIEPLRSKLDFPEVARKFAMIDDYATRSILVPYDEKALEGIRQLARGYMFDMALRRGVQRYQVNLYPHDFERAQLNGAIYEVAKDSDIWACQERFYSREVGFVLESDAVLLAGF